MARDDPETVWIVRHPTRGLLTSTARRDREGSIGVVCGFRGAQAILSDGYSVEEFDLVPAGSGGPPVTPPVLRAPNRAIRLNGSLVPAAVFAGHVVSAILTGVPAVVLPNTRDEEGRFEFEFEGDWSRVLAGRDLPVIREDEPSGADHE